MQRHVETCREKRWKIQKRSMKETWNMVKSSNIGITTVPAREETEGRDVMFKEIMTEKFPKMMKDIKMQIKGTTGKTDPKKSTYKNKVKLLKQRQKETLKNTQNE